MRRWPIALAVLLLGRSRRRPDVPARARVLPEHLAPRGGETAVIALLLGTAAAAALFVVAYVVEPSTQLLGLALGAAFALLAAALFAASRLLVPQERRVERRSGLVHEEEQAEIVAALRESTDGISRRRLLGTVAGAAGLALGAALVVPAASLGPLSTERLLETPWRRGTRLVDEAGRPLTADDVPLGAFLTGFAEGAERDTFDSPLVVVRLPVEMIEVRPEWAPEGVLAFSKICPHAGCAISLFRWPLHEPTAPEPALVCPCHYSTFEPHRGGRLVFGPAGRDLPQLPLRLGAGGALEAADPFPVGVGPSWWGVRLT